MFVAVFVAVTTTSSRVPAEPVFRSVAGAAPSIAGLAPDRTTVNPNSFLNGLRFDAELFIVSPERVSNRNESLLLLALEFQTDRGRRCLTFFNFSYVKRPEIELHVNFWR
jgi:hypothetical protein